MNLKKYTVVGVFDYDQRPFAKLVWAASANQAAEIVQDRTYLMRGVQVFPGHLTPIL